MKKPLKIVLFSLLGLAAAFGAVVGVYALAHRNDSVKVYPVQDYAMTGYWGDTQEYYGCVTLDEIQPVYLSSTQKLGEVLVQEGDTVQIGDPLMRYDTTLTEVSLERKRLEVEKLRLELEDLQEYLAEINCMVPYVPPVVTPTPVPTAAPTPVQPDSLPALLSGTGTMEDPLVILWPQKEPFTEDYIRSLLGEDDTVSVCFQTYADDLLTDTPENQWNICFAQDEEGKLSFSMFEPLPEEELLPDPESVVTEQETSGYTYAEIAAMRSDCEESIRDKTLSIKVAEVAYAQMQHEAGDNIIYSKVDGVVKTVNTGEDGLSGKEPVIYVTGGDGGYLVQAELGELALHSCAVGQTVTVTSWESGIVSEGVIQSVSDTPTGNLDSATNSSCYAFTVAIGEDAGYAENEYVSLTFEAQTEDEDGFYLETPFILTEGGKSYVWVQGEDGLLTKREIVTGASLWGSYLKVESGLTLEDKVAFPYGKTIAEGVKTEDGTWEDLYGGY